MKAKIIVDVKSRVKPYVFDDVRNWNFEQHEVGYLYLSDLKGKQAYISESDILRICVYKDYEEDL